MPELFDKWLLPSSQREYMAMPDTFSLQVPGPFAGNTATGRLSSANATSPGSIQAEKPMILGSFRADEVLSFTPNIDCSIGHAKGLLRSAARGTSGTQAGYLVDWSISKSPTTGKR